MNDALEIVMSWIIIFVVMLFVIVTGEFVGEINKVDSFHAQVNPIIEEYGGDSDKSMDYFTHDDSQADSSQSAQQKIAQISTRMLEHNHIAFVVTPETNEANNDFPSALNNNYMNSLPDNNTVPSPAQLKSFTTGAVDSGDETNAIAPFGHEINYQVRIITPYRFGNRFVQHMFDKTIKYSTTSKVGQDD